MESKSKSQMRRFEAQIPDYKALMRVVRATEKMLDTDCPSCRSAYIPIIREALDALPEYLRCQEN